MVNVGSSPRRAARLSGCGRFQARRRVIKSLMIREKASAVLSAIRTIENERQALQALEEAIRTASEGGLRSAFSEAVQLISAASGRVIVTGMGKSGHIGRKIAATLAPTRP